MIKLYSYELSGNAYKVQLMLSLLGLEYELVRVDLFQGEHKTPEFLELNPFGQIPVLTDGELVLQDAQAILVYLARRYGNEDWLPLEAEPMSRVMRWLSTATGEIRQGVEYARRYHKFNMEYINIEYATQKSEYILKIIDEHLGKNNWLALDRPTIADVACFPYVALASDAKISLEPYPNVQAWIERIKQLPGFIGMPGI
ncbi:glutathione S-transferase family protein [Dapis sp. BLCC M172]|uniref:glutathione S-transferase family protein n=1 Tax=Dapis sp. BLCC M172 TaxID=2975281 RepID=UPI003CF6E497